MQSDKIETVQKSLSKDQKLSKNMSSYIKIWQGKDGKTRKESPVKNFIREMESNICDFDINTVWKWSLPNVRKYRTFVTQKFENPRVMFNIMILDKQIQDL